MFGSGSTSGFGHMNGPLSRCPHSSRSAVQWHPAMGARGYHRTLNPLNFGMLALKVTLVPLFLLVVSMSGKWWGPSIAGWLAGLPVVAGPILFILVLAHGPSFGARAATLSLSAILASEAFNFAYAWTCRLRSWPVALSVGLITWFICKRSIWHTRDQYGRVATVTSIRWLDQALLRGQAVGFEKLNGSRSVITASNARCGNSLSTRTRYA